MGRPRKTLRELVADRSFIARKHRDRLLEAPLERADLRALQARYFAAELDYERAAIAVEFERVARRSPPVDGRPATARELLYAAIGPGGILSYDELGVRRGDGSIDWQAADALERRWQAWDRRHGTAWRYLRGHPNNVDLFRLGRRLGERRPRTVADAQTIIERRRGDVDTLLADATPPDPPGLEHAR